MIYLQDPDVTLLQGDALEVLKTLPDESVHCCVTSPPFYGLRDYSVDGQIGLEATPEEWVAKLVAVFREVRRVLRPDGTLWVEVGDTFNAGTGAGRQGQDGQMADRSIVKARDHGNWTNPTGGRRVKDPGCKVKDLLLTPFRLAAAMQEPYYTGTIKRETDRAWLAAMIEAEGCIFVHRVKAGTPTGRNNTPRLADNFGPGLHVTAADPLIAERCREIAGCGRVTSRPYSDKRTAYYWRVDRRDTRRVLREVYPYLVSKRQQARIAFGCPTSGTEAGAAWEALKLLHAGSQTTVDLPAPPSLFEQGWWLRQANVWWHTNCLPESVRDRPTSAHSYVFEFARSGSPQFWTHAFESRPGVRHKPEPDYWWTPPPGVLLAPVRSHPDIDEGYEAQGWTKRNAWRGHDYFYDQVAVQEPAAWDRWGDQTTPKVQPGKANWIQPKGKNELTGDRRKDGFNARWDAAEHDGTAPRTRNLRSVWPIPTQGYPEAHFAVFPERIAEIPILAGTSERGCCPECGAPRVRQVASSYDAEGRTTNGPRSLERRDETAGFAQRLVRSTSTLGWRPSCDHDTEPTPCTVLDPFVGSGTTCHVARKHGRHAIGIDLSADYLKLAANRLAQQSLLAEVP